VNAFFDMDFTLPLDRFNLRIQCQTEQRTLGVFGPSGSGKTSLLQTVAGLRQAEGTIRIGRELFLDKSSALNLPPEKRMVGFVPQDHRLFPHLNVQGNLASGMPRAIHKHGSQSVEQRRKEVVDVLELQPLLQRRIGSLSGGESQRVAIGRALCSMPEVLLLDEPLASLDHQLRERILPFLMRVRREFDIPMLVVSHNPAELQILCEEVLVLREGSIIASGSALEVLPRFANQSETDTGDYENVLKLKLTSHETTVSKADLVLSSGTGPRLTLPKQTQTLGTVIHAGIAANELILARSTITGLSARNELTGIIRQIETKPWGSLVVVEIDPASETQLTAALTQNAIEELMLEPGLAVHLFFKSNVLRVYG
jgi:molybdate transport system ATP-binding protein